MDVESLLLQSSDEEEEDDSVGHYRSVDEILLNHLDDEEDVVASTSGSNWKRDRGLSTNTYSSVANEANRSGGLQLFSGNRSGLLIRRSTVTKPGAALAAAIAASRPINLRRQITNRISDKGSGNGRDLGSLGGSSSSAVSKEQPEFTSEKVDISPQKEEQHIERDLAEDDDNVLNFDESLVDTAQETLRPIAHDCSSSSSEVEAAHEMQSEPEMADRLSVDEQVVDRQNEAGVSDEFVEEHSDVVRDDNECVSVREEVHQDMVHEDGIGSRNEVTDIGHVLNSHLENNDISKNNVEDMVREPASHLEEEEDDDTETTKLQQQTPDSSLKPLDLAEEIEKKQASTGLHYVEGAASQPMRLEGVKRGSTILGYFDVSSDNIITRTISSPVFRRDHGSPQAVAVHINYIAVGLSKGSIFIISSKYNAHHVDQMEGKMTPLALQGDGSVVPVTSICFNQQGDLLFAGYGDGHVVVWDVQKASALKVVAEHRAPVVHILYLGQDRQVTRQFNVISGDSKGVVKLLQFSVVPWINRISYTKPTTLLDETTSRVLCASPLLYTEASGSAVMPFQSGSAVSNSIGSMIGGVADQGVVVFGTYQSALVAKVSPSVEIYAQIPKPDGIGEGAMPYAAWRCLSPDYSSERTSLETSEIVSLLAIVRDRNVQIAKLVKSKIKVVEKWALESTANGLAWLGDEVLAVLTSTEQLYLYTKDGNVIHQTSFSLDNPQRDDKISHHIYFANAVGNSEKAYHNSVGVRGASIYMLGPDQLTICRLLSWKERIEVLRRAGDWMGALNMGLTLYDGKTHGVIDLPKNLDNIRKIVIPYLVELLQSYVSEVFSYISVACGNQSVDEIKEQYARVGGVAVEFCVHVGRTDMLFDEIVAKFCEAQQKETFLEVLEPYILKDLLGSLPPAIMQALVEHYSKRGWLQRIEQCVLHMDILSLDFNQVIRLCREHGLHGALIYLFNKGLDDFRAPLEELLVVLQNSKRDVANPLGYRMLVYLKYCFQGLAFPPGRGVLPPSRLSSLRKELLLFLLEGPSAANVPKAAKFQSNGTCLNLLYLLRLDTEATLDVLRCAFSKIELPEVTLETADIDFDSAENQQLVQKVVDVLASVLSGSLSQTEVSTCSKGDSPAEIWPSKEDSAHVYDFVTYYVAYRGATVSREILRQILEYLTSETNTHYDMPEKIIQVSKRREKQLLSLLEVVPETQLDVPYLLQLCENVQFHQACGYIHAMRHQYITAMDSYMKAASEPVYALSFIHDMLRLLRDEERESFESAVIYRIPDLLILSREGTYFLILEHFSGKSQYILSELRSHPESLFLHLKTVFEVHTTGTIDISSLENVDSLEFPSTRRAQQQPTGVQIFREAMSSSLKHLQHNKITVTDEMTETYFELLCQYDRESVIKFLETSESYRVEHCLRLCQEYKILDAASFLLEKAGYVGSALLLILSNLSEKFAALDTEIQKGISGNTFDDLNATLKKKEVSEILDFIQACIRLCQRNSPRLEEDESESLWFQLLDSFCQPLIDSGSTTTDSETEMLRKSLVGSSIELEFDWGTNARWKLSKSHKNAPLMRKLFSVFIREIVEGMIGYVQPLRIMMKFLSDNGDQEFGDYKLTILGMLGTYDFERRILDTAKKLIEDDTYYTMNLLKKGVSRGFAPGNLACCICNSQLFKSSSDSNIQVFGCGHAMHLECQLPENESSSSRSSLAGCPICAPRKKFQGPNGKSMLVENGLVNKVTSRTQRTRRNPSLPIDHDISDSSHNSHSIPRFKLLESIQKDEKSILMEMEPQLRLAPPAQYHEKVKKGKDILSGDSGNVVPKSDKSKVQNIRDVKVKGSSVRFPLKSNLFGKDKITRR